MASAKVSFVPSPDPAVIGYKLYSRKDRYDTPKIVDLGIPPVVDGRSLMIVPEAVLEENEYFVTACNSIGEESVGSNIVKYDPRIDPPSELVVEDV